MHLNALAHLPDLNLWLAFSSFLTSINPNVHDLCNPKLHVMIVPGLSKTHPYLHHRQVNAYILQSYEAIRIQQRYLLSSIAAGKSTKSNQNTHTYILYDSATHTCTLPYLQPNTCARLLPELRITRLSPP